ncbi:hypothetical protein ACVJGD_007820 [Bradyrhizobium sp. USDA 10063]
MDGVFSEILFCSLRNVGSAHARRRCCFDELSTSSPDSRVVGSVKFSIEDQHLLPGNRTLAAAEGLQIDIRRYFPSPPFSSPFHDAGMLVTALQYSGWPLARLFHRQSRRHRPEFLRIASTADTARLTAHIPFRSRRGNARLRPCTALTILRRRVLCCIVVSSATAASMESELVPTFLGSFAVGTLITERPPHNTVRAAFPHTASTLGE